MSGEQPKELSKAQRQARKEEVDVLKSTGRKRNSALAFGKKKNSGNEVESDEMQNEGNVDARPIQAKSKKAKKQRAVVIAHSDNELGKQRPTVMLLKKGNRPGKNIHLASDSTYQISRSLSVSTENIRLSDL